jgi:hypothetical protein
MPIIFILFLFSISAYANCVQPSYEISKSNCERHLTINTEARVINCAIADVNKRQSEYQSCLQQEQFAAQKVSNQEQLAAECADRQTIIDRCQEYIGEPGGRNTQECNLAVRCGFPLPLQQRAEDESNKLLQTPDQEDGSDPQDNYGFEADAPTA